VAEIAARGHDLGVHGWAHDRFLALRSPAAVAEDLARTLDAIERAAGVRPRFFRPPVGITSPRVADGARRAGLEIVAWSVKGRDGLSSARPERVARRVADALAPGSIVLLHDAAEHDDFEPAGIEALPRILSAASDKRLRVVPLVELLGARE
jgi:peptidoglycan/xylan/chitin deacetylase (PgdA/CDA1 family)